MFGEHYSYYAGFRLCLRQNHSVKCKSHIDIIYPWGFREVAKQQIQDQLVHIFDLNVSLAAEIVVELRKPGTKAFIW